MTNLKIFFNYLFITNVKAKKISEYNKVLMYFIQIIAIGTFINTLNRNLKKVTGTLY